MEKIIVIKVGSSVLLTKRHKIDQFRIKHLAEQIATLRGEGFGIVLVMSGAVAYGSQFIDLSQHTAHNRSVAAGIGQIYIMTALNAVFSDFNLQITQLLITKEYFLANKKQVKAIIESSLTSAFIPVINENDVVDLNSFGGNDFLAAEIALQLNTEKVFFLSTQKGSIHGVGGGKTKLQAQKNLRREHITATIVNGKQKNILLMV